MLLFIVVAVLAFSVRLAAAEQIADTALSDEIDATTASAEHLSPSELAEAAAFDVDWSDADAADARAERREREPNRIGRVALAITWRRTVRESETRPIDGIASPIDPITTARGVLWVLLTWSR